MEPQEFGKEFVSADCGNNYHDTCSHLSGIGGGFSSGRPGVTVSAMHCHCPCHAKCPLDTSQAVTIRGWYDICDCPGAALGRGRAGPPPNVTDLMRRSRDEARLRREASAAARVASAGKTREEIRGLLAAETHARGLLPLPPPFLELELDSIMTGRSAFVRLRLAGRGMRMLVGTGRKVSRDLHELFQGGGPNLILDTEPIIVYADRSRSAIEAEPDPAACEYLLSGDSAGPANTEERGFFVLLKSETSPAGAGQVGIYAADRRIGILSDTDSIAYSASLEVGRQANRPVVTEAILRRHPDGSWRLNLYQPEA